MLQTNGFYTGKTSNNACFQTVCLIINRITLVFVRKYEF